MGVHNGLDDLEFYTDEPGDHLYMLFMGSCGVQWDAENPNLLKSDGNNKNVVPA